MGVRKTPSSPTPTPRTLAPNYRWGRVEIFKRAGHFPHLDYPDRFDRVFSEFMTDCGVGIGTGPKAVSS